MRVYLRTAVALGVLVAALLAAAPGGAQTAADNTLQIKLSPDTGPVGTLVNVTVSRFQIPIHGCPVEITVDGLSVAFFDPFDGVTAAQFAVPNVKPGKHKVAVQTSHGHAVGTFTVLDTSPPGSMSPTATARLCPHVLSEIHDAVVGGDR